MVACLWLSRLGCRNKPFYRVMAADSRSPRDGKHLEVLGYYNPLPEVLIKFNFQNDAGQDGSKRMGINFDRVNIFMRPVDPMTGRVMMQGKQEHVALEEDPKVDEVDEEESSSS
ncbi:hypothetical protein CDL12_05831 [Handroanthus impetiginosus]|uniref:Mitochondrial/chloroplast ribosomal protein S16 n=1 Tax=Handroanthus impetiginosus TaxID=429701 RepID=A0A2G9HVE5_9LAMI|nr:hypothetical protein CDL12_05831 [Handroanthus impetiginosus]